jgi:hypothetical protein
MSFVISFGKHRYGGTIKGSQYPGGWLLSVLRGLALNASDSIRLPFGATTGTSLLVSHLISESYFPLRSLGLMFFMRLW